MTSEEFGITKKVNFTLADNPLMVQMCDEYAKRICEARHPKKPDPDKDRKTEEEAAEAWKDKKQLEEFHEFYEYEQSKIRLEKFEEKFFVKKDREHDNL